MLRTANLTGKSAVQTDVQPTKLAVRIIWDLATSWQLQRSPRIDAHRRQPNQNQLAMSSTPTVQQPPSARQPEQPLRQTTPPPTTRSPAPQTATLIFSRPTKTATPATSVQTCSLLRNDLRPHPRPKIPDQRNNNAASVRLWLPSATSTDVHRSRHYRRREVWNTRLQQLRHSTTGSRKAIHIMATAREIQIRENLSDRTTRRRGTNRHRPSLPTKNDQKRPSTLIFQSTSSVPRTAREWPTSKFHHETWCNYLESYSGIKPQSNEKR